MGLTGHNSTLEWVVGRNVPKKKSVRFAQRSTIAMPKAESELQVANVETAKADSEQQISCCKAHELADPVTKKTESEQQCCKGCCCTIEQATGTSNDHIKQSLCHCSKVYVKSTKTKSYPEDNSEILCFRCQQSKGAREPCNICQTRDKISEKKKKNSSTSKPCEKCGARKGSESSTSEGERGPTKDGKVQNGPRTNASERQHNQQDKNRPLPQKSSTPISYQNKSNTSRSTSFPSNARSVNKMVKWIIQPARGDVVLREDVIECAEDPRPNAFFDLKTGVLRVYHGPLYGNPFATLVPLSSTMMPMKTFTSTGSPPPNMQGPQKGSPLADPWKVSSSQPDQNSPENTERFNSQPTPVPGEWVNDSNQNPNSSSGWDGHNGDSNRSNQNNENDGWQNYRGSNDSGNKDAGNSRSNNQPGNDSWDNNIGAGNTTSPNLNKNNSNTRHRAHGIHSGGQILNDSTGWGNHISNEQGHGNGTAVSQLNNNNETSWCNTGPNGQFLNCNSNHVCPHNFCTRSGPSFRSFDDNDNNNNIDRNQQTTSSKNFNNLTTNNQIPSCRQENQSQTNVNSTPAIFKCTHCAGVSMNDITTAGQFPQFNDNSGGIQNQIQTRTGMGPQYGGYPMATGFNPSWGGGFPYYSETATFPNVSNTNPADDTWGNGGGNAQNTGW